MDVYHLNVYVILEGLTTTVECSAISSYISVLCHEGGCSSLLRHWPGNHEVPGSMPGWGFLLLLLPCMARNFTPIASHSCVEE